MQKSLSNDCEKSALLVRKYHKAQRNEHVSKKIIIAGTVGMSCASALAATSLEHQQLYLQQPKLNASSDFAEPIYRNASKVNAGPSGLDKNSQDYFKEQIVLTPADVVKKYFTMGQ